MDKIRAKIETFLNGTADEIFGKKLPYGNSENVQKTAPQAKCLKPAKKQ
jgi:hypothetical protein